jgi:hypothetical protein
LKSFFVYRCRPFEGIASHRQTTNKSAKNLEKSDFFKESASPISGGTRAILLPHIVVFKKKIPSKVTRVIFANKTARIQPKK